jgi:hypothetical protein
MIAFWPSTLLLLLLLLPEREDTTRWRVSRHRNPMAPAPRWQTWYWSASRRDTSWSSIPAVMEAFGIVVIVVVVSSWWFWPSRANSLNDHCTRPLDDLYKAGAKRFIAGSKVSLHWYSFAVCAWRTRTCDGHFGARFDSHLSQVHRQHPPPSATNRTTKAMQPLIVATSFTSFFPI